MLDEELLEARCEVAEAFLVDMLADDYIKEDRRLIFITPEPEKISLGSAEAFTETLHEKKLLNEDPFSPLYRQMIEDIDRSPMDDCNSLTSFITNGPNASRFTTKKPPPTNFDDDHPVIYVSISLPVISEDNEEALMLSGISFAPLGGGGSEVYLRKNKNGKWLVKYKHLTWVS